MSLSQQFCSCSPFRSLHITKAILCSWIKWHLSHRDEDWGVQHCPAHTVPLSFDFTASTKARQQHQHHYLLCHFLWLKKGEYHFQLGPHHTEKRRGRKCRRERAFLNHVTPEILVIELISPSQIAPDSNFWVIPPCPYLDPQVFIFIYFFSPVHLRRGVINQLYWATGVQPDSTHESRWGTKLWNPAGSLMSYWLPGWPEHQWGRKRTKNQEPQRNQDKPGVKSKKRITWNSEIICPPQKELFPMDTS